jgi:DNA-directed RNA polymerase omega subunit
LNRFGNVDSKFRFVILASKRAKQLLRGAKPKIKAKSRNPIRIAQSEVRAGVIEFEILPTQKEEYQEQEDRVFVGEGIHDEVLEPDEVPAGKEDLVTEEVEGEVDEETDDEGSGDDEEESGTEKDE